MPIKNRFVEYLTKRYPNLQSEPLTERIAENLISPFTLKLPIEVKKQIELCAEAAFELRQDPKYIEWIKRRHPSLSFAADRNLAICNSLDFHYNNLQGLKLIEINTNAAFLALGLLMYDFRQVPPPLPFSFTDFTDCLLNEYELCFKKKITPDELKVAIVDAHPEQQRLFIEFLVYREALREQNIKCDFLDYRDDKLKNYNFIYNRHTDFFLQETESKNLRDLYIEAKSCISPHPFEYAALADKSLFEIWPSLKEAKTLTAFLPETKSLSKDLSEVIWKDRKKYFFKPKNAFGSKQSYRGSSISRKAFDEICNENFIAQEFLSPGEAKFDLNGESYIFKYDLRAHFYKNKVQMITARLYQGQVTNLQTPLGGFAPIIFEN